MSDPPASPAVLRRETWRSVLRVMALVLAVLGAALAAAERYPCRGVGERVLAILLSLMLAEIPAATLAVAATRMEVAARVLFIATLWLASPFLLVTWFVTGICP